MKYTTLLFDADGTLYDFDKAEDVALKSFLKQIDISIPFEQFKHIYEFENALLWKAFEEGKVTAGEVKVKRFENTMQKLSIFKYDGNELSNLYISELAKCDYLLNGAEKLIEIIHDSYNLLIITNGLWDVQRFRIGESDLYKYFSGLIVSENVGSAKPDKKIFDKTFEKASNPDREKVLIIGDSLSSDIQGGLKYGIDTCWFNLSGADNHGDIIPTYEVRSFEELKELLSS